MWARAASCASDRRGCRGPRQSALARGRRLPWLALLPWAFLAGAPVCAQGSDDETVRRSLRREPSAAITEEDPLEGLLENGFSEERWRMRLSVADLARRERNFEVLLSRARLDPLAHAFLEELGRGRGELAWTARLALRELRVPEPAPPLAGLRGESYAERFVDAFRRTASEHPELHFLVPDAEPREKVPRQEVHAVAFLTVHLVQRGAGATIEISGEGPSGRLKRRFDGRSLVEILDSQPELARQIQLSVAALPEELDLSFVAPFNVGGGPRAGPSQRVAPSPPLAAGPPASGAPPGGEAEELDPYFAPTKLVPVRTDVLGVVVEPVRAREASALEIQQGLRVLRIEPGTIADRLGLRSGDVLLEFDGKALARPQDITDCMAARDRDAPLVLIWLDDLNTPIRGVWRPDLE